MIYKGEYTKEISFPLGGIGTGSIGLAGNGALMDWEIFNRPNKGGGNYYSFFAIRAEYPDGHSVTKILQGDWLKDLSGQYSRTNFCGFGFGPNGGTMAGFPHFKDVTFDGRFPTATLTFSDSDFPALVTMDAFSPFIPLDSENSSLPVALFRLSVDSKEEGIMYTAVLSLCNPFARTLNYDTSSGGVTMMTGRHAGLSRDDRDYGDVTAAVLNKEEKILQRYWYRSGWQQDFIHTFWHELTSGELYDRSYDEPTDSFRSRGDIGTVGTSAVAKGSPLSFDFAISWNVPNSYNYWSPCKDADGKDITWKNYYATRFEDSAESAYYALSNIDGLYKKTVAFRDSLHSSTLDSAVIDAASSTLSVLRSPTVLRLEDGTFYGWEGVHELEGSCEGTCTHVWSYAYALCFLFPDLERSLRDYEFGYDINDAGAMRFRSALPAGRGMSDADRRDFFPCLDGQMATVLKTYREWKISGDDEWLKKSFGHAKALLEFAWSEANWMRWDRDCDGVLEGRQHHTLDMEMFGPSAWLQGMYLAALRAASEMAGYLGDTESREKYNEIFEKGYQWTKENLFNGKYFIHKVDIRDKTPAERFDCPGYWNDEKGELKYQIGEGCEIDQLLGQWHAHLCGLGDIFDREQRRTALENMFANNFKPSLREFANVWRVFALNDEGGAVMCDYPEGARRPIIPIPYTDECMTGFEYSFAGLLIAEGLVEEGLCVVRAVRDRYDGRKRNPYNEIECGSNYARPMASFALLPIFSGFEFDMPRGHIGFSPIVKGDFRCMWSLGCAWGDYIREGESCRVKINDGQLVLRSLRLGGIGKVRELLIDGKKAEFSQSGELISFAPSAISKDIYVVI